MLDHENLDVYRLSIDFAAWAHLLAKDVKGIDRHARDQLLRASQSVGLNIAEASGKFSAAERQRFFQIACGSARECGAVIDILERCDVITSSKKAEGKEMLVRIVSMLSKMIDRRFVRRE
jgi:four helix bundle protein